MYNSRNIWELDCNQCESLISEYKCTLSDDFCQDNQPHKWVHAGCGGHLRLYENGKEKCQKCGYENVYSRIGECSCLYGRSVESTRYIFTISVI